MNEQKHPYIHVLGTKVHMVEILNVAAQMEYWINNENDRCHHVVNSGMHGVMTAYRNEEIKTVFRSVDLFAADGILMVLLARLRGFKLRKKNTGPDILWEFAKLSDERGYTHYFYGDEEPVLEGLINNLKKTFPNLRVVGHRAPPFRELSDQEEASDISDINQSAPDVLWVGLGMPKQELWISKHRNQLHVPVAVGAGAMFKFFSGDVNRGPQWLRDIGFEWLFRLISEPKRIWRRVFIDSPQFVILVLLEFLGIKKYSKRDHTQD